VCTVRVPPSLGFFFFPFYTIFFLLFILLRAPLFLHVKLLCNYREDVGFSEQRGIPRFFFFLLRCRSLFRNSFFLCISSLLFTGPFFLFNNDEKRGDLFFLSMIQTFSMKRKMPKMGRKKGPYYLSSSFGFVVLKLRDYCPLPIITPRLLSFGKGIWEADPLKVRRNPFWLFYGCNLNLENWRKSGTDFKDSSVQQSILDFLFLCGNHQKVMGESRWRPDISCKDANVVEFFQLFGGGKDVVWLGSSNKMWKKG